MSVDKISITPEMLELLKKPKQNLTPFGSCLCGKLLDVAEHTRKWFSGGVNYTELLCVDCRKEFHLMPRIVCLGCRSLMGFTTPSRQKTGFEFRKASHYHIATCLKCDSEAAATPVLEHEQYCRQMGIPTQANLDLLQDIEQKVLQGKADAAKLRSEFESSGQDED